MPIVEAVMAIASVRDQATQRENRSLSKKIEKAMSDAVMACYAKGITDPVEVKAAMMAAREVAKRGPPGDEDLPVLLAAD